MKEARWERAIALRGSAGANNGIDFMRVRDARVDNCKKPKETLKILAYLYCGHFAATPDSCLSKGRCCA